MDTETGQIRRITHNEPLKSGEVELGRKPNPHCKQCWGRGSFTLIINKKKFKWPCYCTRPVLTSKILERLKDKPLME